MFLGQFYHNLDEKNRLTMPARFRELLVAEGAYLTQGFDQNLMVLPSSMFEIFSARINRISLTNPDVRSLRRLIFSNAASIEFDRLGRILIPQYLRNLAGLRDEAIILGVGNYIEIWSPMYWSVESEQLQNAELNARRYGALDLASE